MRGRAIRAGRGGGWYWARLRGGLVALGVAHLLASVALGALDVASTLPVRAYVWQRLWTPAVVRAVRDHATSFAALDVLAAELSFSGGASQRTVAQVDWPVLAALGRPVAVVVRIGPSPSAWRAQDPETNFVLASCREALAAARAHSVEVTELQLDFDAAAARLGDYLRLVNSLRSALLGEHVVITTLPSWLGRPEFRTLIAAVDGYVLQVHSLAKPRSSAEPFELLDPESALRWIEQAAALGRPFRVALPTYGYRVAFRASGEFLGLQAEGAPRPWPAGTVIRTLRANADAIAPLVRRLQLSPPAGCEAICWFRLPTAQDELAWRWPTLVTVMAGDAPRAHWVVEVRTGTAGAVDVVLRNDGTAAALAPVVTLSWSDARLLAADAIGGWTTGERTARTLVLRPPFASTPQDPGEPIALGWLRLDAAVSIAGTTF